MFRFDRKQNRMAGNPDSGLGCVCMLEYVAVYLLYLCSLSC